MGCVFILFVSVFVMDEGNIQISESMWVDRLVKNVSYWLYGFW